MADANVSPFPSPAGWADAFAAMPQENAPRDGWARLVAALPVTAAPMRPARRRYPRPALAIAASLLLAMPVAWWLSTDAGLPARDAVVTDAKAPGAVVRAAPPGVAATGVDSAAPSEGSARTDTPPHRDGLPASATAVAHVGPSVRDGRPTPVERSSPAPAPAPRPPAIASVGPIPSTTADPIATQAGAELDTLRQESARLEALVAFARDERMASAPAAVRASALDERLQLIDAALSQPEVSGELRTSLWSQRVDALQDLASLEGTRRLMAAHGTSMDAVVRVD